MSHTIVVFYNYLEPHLKPQDTLVLDLFSSGKTPCIATKNNAKTMQCPNVVSLFGAITMLSGPSSMWKNETLNPIAAINVPTTDINKFIFLSLRIEKMLAIKTVASAVSKKIIGTMVKSFVESNGVTPLKSSYRPLPGL